MAKRAKSEGVYQFTPKGTLLALLKTVLNKKEKITGISGEIGSAVANATEHHHLHRKAFRQIIDMEKMTDEKLAEYLAHRDYYEEQAGIRTRAEKAPRLEMGDEDPEGAEEHSRGGAAAH